MHRTENIDQQTIPFFSSFSNLKFRKQKTQDAPIAVSSKKSGRTKTKQPQDARMRIKLAFEVIRRRILELSPNERVPVPFQVWKKLMQRCDGELDLENFSIDTLLQENHDAKLIRFVEKDQIAVLFVYLFIFFFLFLESILDTSLMFTRRTLNVSCVLLTTWTLSFNHAIT